MKAYEAFIVDSLTFDHFTEQGNKIVKKMFSNFKKLVRKQFEIIQIKHVRSVLFFFSFF